MKERKIERKKRTYLFEKNKQIKYNNTNKKNYVKEGISLSIMSMLPQDLPLKTCRNIDSQVEMFPTA